MSVLLTQIGQFIGNTTKETRLFATSEALAARDAAITSLRGAVPDAGNTLEKLYQLLAGNRTVHPVANRSERDALTGLLVGDQVFVSDDGDTRWALYLTVGTSPATFVKLSDPDILNEALSAAQVKALYESNLDTNAFTDAEKAYVAALLAGLTSLATTDKTSYVAAINEVLAKANSALAAAQAAQGDVDVLEQSVTSQGTRLTAVEQAQAAIGSFSDFETAYSASAA